MKKWMYVIFPGIMLVVFFFFYFASQKEIADRERQKAEQVAKQKLADDEHKSMIEAKAREDAARHAAERAAEDLRITTEKEAKWQADTHRIQVDTDTSNADLDKYTKLVSELEIQLDTLHKQKEQATRTSFENAKRVELAEVERRNAELDVQRTVAMIAKRADQSSMTRMPPPPPPAAN